MEMFKKIIVVVLIQLYMTSFTYSATLNNSTPKIKPLSNNLINKFANVNGIRLHYIEKGKGHLIILLHGWPETSLSWNKTINVLSGALPVFS